MSFQACGGSSEYYRLGKIDRMEGAYYLPAIKNTAVGIATCEGEIDEQH
jgi:hypothetical protein